MSQLSSAVLCPTLLLFLCSDFALTADNLFTQVLYVGSSRSCAQQFLPCLLQQLHRTYQFRLPLLVCLSKPQLRCCFSMSGIPPNVMSHLCYNMETIYSWLFPMNVAMIALFIFACESQAIQHFLVIILVSRRNVPDHTSPLKQTHQLNH